MISKVAWLDTILPQYGCHVRFDNLGELTLVTAARSAVMLPRPSSALLTIPSRSPAKSTRVFCATFEGGCSGFIPPTLTEYLSCSSRRRDGTAELGTASSWRPDTVSTNSHSPHSTQLWQYTPCPIVKVSHDGQAIRIHRWARAHTGEPTR